MHTIRNWTYHMTWIILRVNVAIVLNTIKSIQNTVLGPLMHISIFACMFAFTVFVNKGRGVKFQITYQSYN